MRHHNRYCLATGLGHDFSNRLVDFVDVNYASKSGCAKPRCYRASPTNKTTRKGKAMRRIRKFLTKLWTDENAISSVEYALLLAFVASGIIVAADSLSNAVSNEMAQAANCIEGTGPTEECP